MEQNLVERLTAIQEVKMFCLLWKLNIHYHV